MTEWRLFPEGTVPEWTTREWYQERERAPHLEQGGHRGRLMKAATYIDRAISAGANTVVDLGAGDGGLLSLIHRAGVRCWGYDLQPSNIEGGKIRGVDVMLADVLTAPIEWGDVVVATEMLEHLLDPHGFVRQIADHALWLVASSPAYESFQSHYGFHCWAWDMDGYRALVEQGGFMVVEHSITGDFQVLLAQR